MKTITVGCNLSKNYQSFRSEITLHFEDTATQEEIAQAKQEAYKKCVADCQEQLKIVGAI
jgi:hypothetical protein